jgi:hypothetical protein
MRRRRRAAADAADERISPPPDRIGMKLRLPSSSGAVPAPSAAERLLATREAASDLITRSPAFEAPGPWDPLVEPEKTVAKDMKRRLLRVESVLVRQDGPWGMAATATVPFIWRWQSGPLAGVTTAEGEAALAESEDHSEQLQEQLWHAERGED